MSSPRVPLHMQRHLSGLQKAQTNPSYESFRPNIINRPVYRIQPPSDRPAANHARSMIRRYPNGALDYATAVELVLDAVRNIGVHAEVLPVQQALLTVVFPGKFRLMEPMAAAMMADLSDSEKSAIAALAGAKLLEEANWNAGYGGGSTPGASITRDGMP